MAAAVSFAALASASSLPGDPAVEVPLSPFAGAWENENQYRVVGTAEDDRIGGVQRKEGAVIGGVREERGSGGDTPDAKGKVRGN